MHYACSCFRACNKPAFRKIIEVLLFYRDLPSDILHHVVLGWYKKAVEELKNQILTNEDMDHICAIIDKLEWKVCVLAA